VGVGGAILAVCLFSMIYVMMTYHTSVDTKTTVAHTTESYNRLKNSFMVKDSGSSDLETTKAALTEDLNNPIPNDIPPLPGGAPGEDPPRDASLDPGGGDGPASDRVEPPEEKRMGRRDLNNNNTTGEKDSEEERRDFGVISEPEAEARASNGSLASASSRGQPSPQEASSGLHRFKSLEDEDSYNLTDVGFPEKALSIEEARLCDRVLQPWLKGSMYSCPDPTCLKCARYDYERKEALIKAFKEDSFEKRRLDLYKKHFKPNTSVVVMSVNMGQIHLWLNWVCSCELNGIEVRSFTLMIPTDEKAAKIIAKNGFISLETSWLKKLHFKIDSIWEGPDRLGWNPHMQGHSDINSVTVIVANEIIRLDYTLLLHDVDIVWKLDPREYLAREVVHRDLLVMFAPRWDALGVANSGFVWMVPNRRTKIFMQTLENLLPIKGISDQQLWNAVLRHYKFRQIAFRVLPMKQFQLLYDHTLRKWNLVEKYAMVVHGVSHRKTYRLAKAKLWYFNSTCSAFDEALVPCKGEFFAPHCKT